MRTEALGHQHGQAGFRTDLYRLGLGVESGASNVVDEDDRADHHGKKDGHSDASANHLWGSYTRRLAAPRDADER